MPHRPAISTLGDLYSALDWSAAESRLSQWLATRPDAEIHDLTDQSRNFRLVLLDEALFGAADKRDEARKQLQMAGVWTQVSAIMRELGVFKSENGQNRPEEPFSA